MIKKMRNKMLLMSMISTFCLIVIAFSAIYMITYRNIEEKISESMRRTYTFHRPMHFHSQKGATSQSENSRPRSGERREFPERKLKDVNSFSVFVDSEGNVHTNSFLGQNSKQYETVAKVALKQNSTKGEFESEDIIWRFETRDARDNAKIIALVDITSEKDMLTQLIISFVVSATVLLILIFLISLHFANRAIRPVLQAWDKQKQFVADASHELKTPLAAINTNIDVLLSKGENKIKDEEKWLRYVKKEVQRLSELTGNLLFMAKMDADVPVEKMKASLSELVESAVLNLEAVAFEKGVKFDYDIEKDISAYINTPQITRLILILMDNAIKYSPKDETVKITLKKISKDHATLSVKNMGEPILEEDIEKIFDRFYRVDESRSTAGYGLGLAMAKEIVQIHKGKISVKSTKENGTRFTVTLAL